MNRKVVDEIKEYFEAYEVMDKLIDHSEYLPSIKLNMYRNDKKQMMHILVIERRVRSKKKRQFLKQMKTNVGDNVFCDFKLEYNKVKFTFRLRSECIERFHEEVKIKMQKKYKCHYHGTTAYVEFYNPKLDDIMDIFTSFEPICKRVDK